MKFFREKSIRSQLKIIIAMVILSFTVLVMVLNGYMQTLLTNIASEYLLVTEQRLKDQLEFEYDKLQAFCVELSSKKALLEFADQSFENRAENVLELNSLLVEYESLEPSILDISIVSDKVHYSGLYGNQTLDEIREETQKKSLIL